VGWSSAPPRSRAAKQSTQIGRCLTPESPGLNSINAGNVLANDPWSGGITVEGGGVMGLLVGLLVLWLVLVVIGFTVKALLWLAIVGLVFFVATAVFGAIRGRALR
jgi:hypothetical protein